MPLTSKGKKIMRSMKDQYGSKKGENVFYASRNKGTIKGVEEGAQMNWQDKLYESLVTEISVETAKKVRDKRRAQADELGKARIKMAKTGRVLDRRGVPDTANLSQVDLDSQTHLARQGLSGAKDKEFKVKDKDRSGVEKRHRPGDHRPGSLEPGSPRSRPESAYDKLETKFRKADDAMRSPRRQGN
jgi:hypothetical protein